MNSPLPIFIGYEAREHDPYRVAVRSIESRASVPVLITPLVIENLGHYIPPPLQKDGMYWDIESEAYQSTTFARSRFCVPFLQNQGWALFADSDTLCLADIKELFNLADDRYAVMVVKHKHESGDDTKMDGQVQAYYERKNWSSVMLWNCSHPAHYRLTPDRLNRWPGRDLHAFKWLQDDEIGELSGEWNHLVGIDQGDAKLLHYTLGTPDMVDSPMADVWFMELHQMEKRKGAVK